MLASNKDLSDLENSLSGAKRKKRHQSFKLTLGVHSMPRTSEKSMKSWMYLGVAVLFIIIVSFLLFIL